MAYLEQYKATNNPDFYGRVYASVHKTATDVLNEDISTAGHAGRADIASRALRDDKNVYDAFVWQCAMNPTIAGNLDSTGATSSPDGDIDYQVSASWNTVVSLAPPLPSTF